MSGITPACAGKSLPAAVDGTLRVGSPPRVRGKGRTACRQSTASRITPACAGKSRRLHKTERRIWDHPRVCGEKFHLNMRADDDGGSPPRVRGKD